MTPFITDANLLPSVFPALIPADDASGSSWLLIAPLIPLADGIICTYACPSSVAIALHLHVSLD